MEENMAEDCLCGVRTVQEGSNTNAQTTLSHSKGFSFCILWSIRLTYHNIPERGVVVLRGVVNQVKAEALQEGSRHGLA